MRRRLAAVLVILMCAPPLAPSERPAGRSFATRSVGRRALRRDASRPRAQLRALRLARRDPAGTNLK